MKHQTIPHSTGVRTVALLGVVAVASLLMSCEQIDSLREWGEFGIPAQGNDTYMELNPVQDLQQHPSLKSQEEGMFLPPPAVVPRNIRRYPAEVLADKELAKNLGNPLPLNVASLDRGRDMYMTYCVVCHGERGLGNGYIIPKFSRPPSLASRKLRKITTDGELFHIISQGQNIMPGYSNQLKPLERWAVVHYIRALQRAEYPTKSDVARAGQAKK